MLTRATVPGLLRSWWSCGCWNISGRRPCPSPCRRRKFPQRIEFVVLRKASRRVTTVKVKILHHCCLESLQGDIHAVDSHTQWYSACTMEVQTAIPNFSLCAWRLRPRTAATIKHLTVYLVKARSGRGQNRFYLKMM